MEEQIRNQANALFMALPSNRLEDLYHRIMATLEFPFHDGPDDTHAGRAFWIFTTR